jgi:hypothetical protein
MRRVAEEIIEQTAIEIFLSENPTDVHWDRHMADGHADNARIISDDERNLYRKRATEQLARELMKEEKTLR